VLGVVGLRRSGALELARAVAGRVESEAASLQVAQDPEGKQGEEDEGLEERVAHVAGPSRHSLEMRQSDVLTTGHEHLEEAERLHLAFVRAIEHDLETSNLHNPLGDLSGGDRQKASIVAVAQTAASAVVLENPTRGVDVAAKEMDELRIETWYPNDDITTAGCQALAQRPVLGQRLIP